MQLSLNACQKYCRMLQGEHSAILLTFIKLPFFIKIFGLSIFECPFYTGFTVILNALTVIFVCKHGQRKPLNLAVYAYARPDQSLLS